MFYYIINEYNEINSSCNSICYFYAKFSSGIWTRTDNNKQHNRSNKITAGQIKKIASEVVNNSTGEINQTEAKNILNQLGEGAKKTALGGADVVSNFSGEIKEGLK
jgi:hypothetical protein